MKKKYVIGVDVGGTNVKVGIIDLKGRIRKKRMFSTGNFSSRRGLINALVEDIRTVLGESGIEKKEVLGIGVGTPGLIDSRRGIIHYLVNIKGFEEVPLKKILEKRLRIPTFLDNDVNIMCLGELHYGNGSGGKNIVCVTLGTGVGGGIAIAGDLYRGSSFSAGEIGHITINEKGPYCNCGNRGCLEAYVGNSYIAKDAVRRLRKDKKSLIRRLVKGDFSKITPRIISEAAGKGDALAKKILIDTGERIGVGLANVINILNPEKVIIGGGVAEAGRILFDSIRASVDRRAMNVPAKAAKIIKARLGRDAGLIGAVALVRKELES